MLNGSAFPKALQNRQNLFADGLPHGRVSSIKSFRLNHIARDLLRRYELAISSSERVQDQPRQFGATEIQVRRA
jgi:hypothetical protein